MLAQIPRPGPMKVAALLFLCRLAACLTTQVIEKPPPPQYNEAVENGTLGFYPHRAYFTYEGVKPPETNFLTWNPQCDDGLMTFLTPRGWALPKPGPMILDSRGELIWTHHFDNKFGGEAYDLLVQTYKGQDYLTFWLGDDRVRGHGAGFYYMLNSSYDIVHKVGAANGMSADLHEFLITDEGTALITIYQIVPGDVTMFRDFDPERPEDRDPNYVWDGVFQEINLETSELIFEWRASEHVNITDTYRPIYSMGTRNDPFDWFHINSIQKDELGNYVISARYPHSITYIDGKTQETIWQLGGKRNSFMDLSGGNATNFAWQHDARFVPLDTFPNMYTPPPERAGFTTKLISFFDNAAEDQHYHFGLPLSRGMLVEVTYPTPGTEKAKAGPSVLGEHVDIYRRDERFDERFDYGGFDDEVRDAYERSNDLKMMAINGSDPDYTVRLIKSYENPNMVRSSSQGSMQILPQGPGEDPKVFVGYGLNAVWTEFAADGTVLCDVHFAAKTSWERGDMQSYRAYKQSWTGTPSWPPSVDISDDDAQVYVSWLGATDVAEWVLQCSDKQTYEEKEWADLVRVPKHYFETTITLPEDFSGARYLRVIALSADGRRLSYGSSRVIDRGIVATYFPSINPSIPTQVSHLSPLRVFLIVVANVSLIFVLYEGYRRYLGWRYGTPSAGAVRWRKGPAYKILGDV